jgi:hypothetical protein
MQDKEVEVLETESDEDCVIVMDNHEDKISHVSRHIAANFQQDFPAICFVLLDFCRDPC